MVYTVIRNTSNNTYFKKTAPSLIYLKIPPNATMKEQLYYMNLYNKGKSILFSEPF